MPEGPEVTKLVKSLRRYMKNKKIENIIYTKKKYNKTFDLLSPRPLKCKDINKKGKFIYFTFLTNDTTTLYMFCSLGLSGHFSKVESKYKQFEIVFTDGTNLYFNDMLSYSHFKVVLEKEELLKKLNKLAPDIIDNNFNVIDNEDFIERVQYTKCHKTYKNKTVAEILSNQERRNGIVSGIGNYLRSEILYTAKINPFMKMKDFNEKLAGDLYKGLVKVLSKVYKASKGQKTLYNDEYTNEYVFRVYKRDHDYKGNKVIKKKIKGRYIYFISDQVNE